MKQVKNFASLTVITVVVAGFLTMPAVVFAQSIMYEDASGGIHFVEKVSQIPREYRGQVLEEEVVYLEQKEYAKTVQKQQREITKRQKTAQKQVAKNAQIQAKAARKARKNKKQKKSKKGKSAKSNSPIEPHTEDVVEAGQPEFLDE